MAELARHPDVIAAVTQGLKAYNTKHSKPSARIARILLQTTPPQADAGEITEKGYMNQSRTLDLRKQDVAKRSSTLCAAPARSPLAAGGSQDYQANAKSVRYIATRPALTPHANALKKCSNT